MSQESPENALEKETAPSYQCSLIWFAVIYTAALAFGIIGAWVVNDFVYDGDLDQIWILLVGQSFSHIPLFLGQIYLDNISVYDTYWFCVPIASSWYYFIIILDNIDFLDSTSTVLSNFSIPWPRIIFCLILCNIFELRLVYYWFRYWKGLIEEDWRYEPLRAQKILESNKFLLWFSVIISIFGLTIIVTFGGCLPLYFAMSYDYIIENVDYNSMWSFNILDIIGFIIGISGFIIEWVADYQLYKWRIIENNNSDNINREKNDVLMTGIWKYSRNPNYFGELLFWLGLGLLGTASVIGIDNNEFDILYTIGGMIPLYVMLIFISIPLKEKHLARKEQRREKLEKYKENVSVLIPWKSGLE